MPKTGNKHKFSSDPNFSKLFNSWRAIIHTDRGRKIGYSPEWSEFSGFYSDMASGYSPGLRLCRVDKSGVFEKNNCVWVTEEQLNNSKDSLVRIEYGGKIQSMRDWADEVGVPLNGLRQRFYKSKNYTAEEIIYGRKTGYKSKVKCFSECTEKSAKRKASKMLSQYRLKDQKKGYDICDIDVGWFMENIANKQCCYCGDTNKIGCDRIDNNKGHTKDNVVPACYTCNTSRQSLFTMDEMLLIGEVIKKIKQNRGEYLDKYPLVKAIV